MHLKKNLNKKESFFKIYKVQNKFSFLTRAVHLVTFGAGVESDAADICPALNPIFNFCGAPVSELENVIRHI